MMERVETSRRETNTSTLSSFLNLSNDKSNRGKIAKRKNEIQRVKS